LGPASTTAHWQVEAAAELQEILVIQDIVEMTIQHHAVFQKNTNVVFDEKLWLFRVLIRSTATKLDHQMECLLVKL